MALPHVRGRLLDIGCGSNELLRRHGNGVGCDVYQWGGVDIVVEDSSNLPFDDASFDTVTIIAALNHIPNRESVLTEAHRVLQPGGRLIVTMIPPTISMIWHKVRAPWDADQHERGMVEGELYGLHPAEVRKLMRNAGFRVILEQPFQLWINRVTVAEKS
jgi:ubiquinone/menaquinone biosynthesis C-methylase UbiE